MVIEVLGGKSRDATWQRLFIGLFAVAKETC